MLHPVVQSISRATSAAHIGDAPGRIGPNVDDAGAVFEAAVQRKIAREFVFWRAAGKPSCDGQEEVLVDGREGMAAVDIVRRAYATASRSSSERADARNQQPSSVLGPKVS
jgi:hypothetical protein